MNGKQIFTAVGAAIVISSAITAAVISNNQTQRQTSKEEPLLSQNTREDSVDTDQNTVSPSSTGPSEANTDATDNISSSLCNSREPGNPNRFVPTPECYEQYLNSEVDWGSGKQIQFSNLEECGEIEMVSVFMYKDTEKNNAYYCRNGFVSITDPRGTQVCRLNTHQETAGGSVKPGVHTLHGGKTLYYVTGCVWKS